MNSKLSGRFKSKRIPWTDYEMRIVLGYYFFIYQYNTREKDYLLFADHLRKMTGNERTNASVKVRFSNYIHIDPERNDGLEGGTQKCQPIWDECINFDRTPKDSFIKLFMDFIELYGNNCDIYDSFIRNYSQFKTLTNEQDVECNNEYSFEEVHYIKENDEIIKRIKSKKINFHNLYNEYSVKDNYINMIKRKRSPDVAAYTRQRANGVCDLCGQNAPFIDKNGIPYLESHHLITLSEGGPDVIFNTVALCPNCHRKIHMLASHDDKMFLKDILYKYLLDENERRIIEKFYELFDKFEI